MKSVLLRISLLLLLSPAAYAHPGHDGNGFLLGAVHPLTGIDHLLALVLVGLALSMGKLGSLRTAFPVIAVALLSGAAVGVFAGAQVWVEWLIILSLPVFAAMLWVTPRVSPQQLLLVVAGLLMGHGWAHGVEAGQQAIPFIAGFVFASLVLVSMTFMLAKQLFGQSVAPVRSDEQ